jgi:hypothetical protein
MKEEFLSITMRLPGEDWRSFNVGDTMASGKIKSIQVDGATFTLVFENGKIKYANIPFIAQSKSK